VDIFEQNLRTLIRKKLYMFPNIKKLIVDAVIEPITEARYRIHVVSTYGRDLLKRYLGGGSSK